MVIHAFRIVDIDEILISVLDVALFFMHYVKIGFSIHPIMIILLHILFREHPYIPDIIKV